MLRCCLLFCRTHISEESAVGVAEKLAVTASPPLSAASQRQRRLSSSLEADSWQKEVEALRVELAAAQFRIAELQLSQLAVHEALLRRLEDTDRAAHRAATELRYTAFALRSNYDLLETELRRVLALGPDTAVTGTHSDVRAPNCGEDATEAARWAAIEAGSREMVRKNIGFRVEKVSDEPAAVSKATSGGDSSSDKITT